MGFTHRLLGLPCDVQGGTEEMGKGLRALLWLLGGEAAHTQCSSQGNSEWD